MNEDKTELRGWNKMENLSLKEYLFKDPGAFVKKYLKNVMRQINTLIKLIIPIFLPLFFVHRSLLLSRYSADAESDDEIHMDSEKQQ